MPSPNLTERETEFVRAFDDALATRLTVHRQAFQGKHQRVVVDAGPQLFRSDQNIDYWTFDHGKRAITDCSADIVHEAIAYAEANGFDPAILVDSAAEALNEFTGHIIEELTLELKRQPVNEHGLTPSTLALENVRRHADGIVRGALGGLRRGIADPRLGTTPHALPFYRRVFSHYGPLLFALAFFAILMIGSL